MDSHQVWFQHWMIIKRIFCSEESPIMEVDLRMRVFTFSSMVHVKEINIF